MLKTSSNMISYKLRLDASLLFRIQNTANLKLRRHGIDEEFPYGFFSGTSTPPPIAIFRAACVSKGTI